MRFKVIDLPGRVKLPARLVCSIILFLLKLFVEGRHVLTAVPNLNGRSAASIHRLKWLLRGSCGHRVQGGTGTDSRLPHAYDTPPCSPLLSRRVTCSSRAWKMESEFHIVPEIWPTFGLRTVPLTGHT